MDACSLRRAELTDALLIVLHRVRMFQVWACLCILQCCVESRLDHVTLTASEEGRPLYESLGFSPGAEMKLKNRK
jgi:hypothetical protein